MDILFIFLFTEQFLLLCKCPSVARIAYLKCAKKNAHYLENVKNYKENDESALYGKISDPGRLVQAQKITGWVRYTNPLKIYE